MRAAADIRASAAPELTITRIFNAPRDLVFKAWTRKEHLDRWCCPRGFTIPWSEGELRSGGAWRACMRSPDGVEHRLGGIYRVIVENELLVFTHAWEDVTGKRGHETLVTVTFADRGGKTEVTLHQAFFESTESRDGHEGGWSESLDRLAEHLATLRMKS